ncbi:uncharacterized protein LOC111887900 [Lactuca sativa]|nr:uncharacterized protein LOC111887900 [Lactuca sativa]
MREAAKNGMRSGLVVIGAVAFGYLTLQLGFKPYLEKAQLYNPDPDEDLNRQSDQQKQQQQQLSSISLNCYPFRWVTLMSSSSMEMMLSTLPIQFSHKID